MSEAGIAALQARLSICQNLGEENYSGIWRENLKSVMAFFAVQSQWNVIGVGGGGLVYIGLDYANVVVGLECSGIKVDPDLWSDIRIMEDAAAAALNRAWAK